MGGGPTTGGTGAAGGAPRGGAGLAGGGNLTVTGKPKGLFKFGDKEVLEKAAQAKAAKIAKDASAAASKERFARESMAEVAFTQPSGHVTTRLRKDDPRFKNLYEGGLRGYEGRLSGVGDRRGRFSGTGTRSGKKFTPEQMAQMQQYQLQASLEYDRFGDPINKEYEWAELRRPGATAADRRRGAGVQGGKSWNIVKAQPVLRGSASDMAGQIQRGMVGAARQHERKELDKQIKHLEFLLVSLDFPYYIALLLLVIPNP